MAAPQITTPPPVPGPDRPTTLESDTQALFNWMANNFTPDVNAMAAWMETTAANVASGALPTGIVITDTFDGTSTADSDPGNGKVRIAAGAVRIDNLDNLGASATGRIDMFDDSTSSVKGILRIYKFGSPSVWWLAKVTGITAMSGYYNVAVTNVLSAGAFTDLDMLVLAFTPNGDAGVSTFTDVTTLVTVSSPTASVVTPILPTDKGEVELKYGFSLSATAVLRAAFSNDNVNWTPNMTVGSSSANHLGSLTLKDFTADKSTVSVEYGSGVGSDWPGVPPDVGPLSTHNANAVSVAGGIKYVRWTPASGNINSGRVYPGRGR